MYIENFEFYSKYFCLLTDTFTDSAISKCNSNHTEGDLKVLQPWEGGEGDELGGLERESSVSTPPKGSDENNRTNMQSSGNTGK